MVFYSMYHSTYAKTLCCLHIQLEPVQHEISFYVNNVYIVMQTESLTSWFNIFVIIQMYFLFPIFRYNSLWGILFPQKRNFEFLHKIHKAKTNKQYFFKLEVLDLMNSSEAFKVVKIHCLLYTNFLPDLLLIIIHSSNP